MPHHLLPEVTYRRDNDLYCRTTAAAKSLSFLCNHVIRNAGVARCGVGTHAGKRTLNETVGNEGFPTPSSPPPFRVGGPPPPPGEEDAWGLFPVKEVTWG